MINNNYASAAVNSVNLGDYCMGTHRIAFGAGDSFGYTSGQNIPDTNAAGLGSITFGIAIYAIGAAAGG